MKSLRERTKRSESRTINSGWITHTSRSGERYAHETTGAVLTSAWPTALPPVPLPSIRASPSGRARARRHLPGPGPTIRGRLEPWCPARRQHPAGVHRSHPRVESLHLHREPVLHLGVWSRSADREPDWNGVGAKDHIGCFRGAQVQDHRGGPRCSVSLSHVPKMAADDQGIRKRFLQTMDQADIIAGRYSESVGVEGNHGVTSR